jgi:hypothetical protein
VHPLKERVGNLAQCPLLPWIQREMGENEGVYRATPKGSEWILRRK